MSTRLSTAQTQSQDLNAQVLQSIRLLGLTSHELKMELHQALAHNPLLEREEDEHEAAPAGDAATPGQETAAYDKLPESPAYATASTGFDSDDLEDRMARVARVAAPMSADPVLRVLEGLDTELKPAHLAIAAAWLERTTDAGYLAGDRDAIDAEITATLKPRRG